MIDVKVCKVNSMFSPPFIKKFVQYISTVRSQPQPEASEVSSMVSSVLKPEDQGESSVAQGKLPTCKDRPTIEAEVRVAIEGAHFVCLHHEYDVPFIKVTLGSTAITFEKRCDHGVLCGWFGDIEVTDMTNYPHTICPKEFPRNPMDYDEIVKKYSFTKLATLRSLKDKPSMELHLYDPPCPDMPTEVPNTTSALILRFEEIWAMYVDEMTLKRVLDYIVDQLSYSFNPKEQYPFEQYAK